MPKLSKEFIQKVWEATEWQDLNPTAVHFSRTIRERFAQDIADSVTAAVSSVAYVMDKIRALFIPYPQGEHGPSDTPDSHYRFGYNTAIEDVLEAVEYSLTPSSDVRALEEIRQVIKDYHFALDNRVHGGVAQDVAFAKICKALDIPWVQGQELKSRLEDV